MRQAAAAWLRVVPDDVSSQRASSGRFDPDRFGASVRIHRVEPVRFRPAASETEP